MTKLRPPVSIENSLYRVLGELGIEQAAAATGRTAGYLRAATDPDSRQQLTVQDLIALDLACREAGDPSFPLFQTVGRLLDLGTAERFACAAELCRIAGDAAREGGEASAALIDLALGATGDRDLLATATRQVEEAHEVWGDALAALRSVHDSQPP